MKGYKAFRKNWRSFEKKRKYSCPGVFEESGELKMYHGIQFCPNLIDCVVYHHYPFHICEIETLGETILDTDREYPLGYTNKLKIIRELSKEEIRDALIHFIADNIVPDASMVYNTSYELSFYYTILYNWLDW